MMKFFAITVLILLSACGVNTVKLDAPSIGLALADVMPTERELEGARHKVVIFPTNDSLSALANDAALGLTLSLELAQYIAPTAADIVDHTHASGLEQEIQQLETAGSHTHNGPLMADFALTSILTDARVTAGFYPAKNWTDKKGQIYKVPAKCTYTASISGSIRLYSTLPRLSHLNSIKLDHTQNNTEETHASECPLPDTRKHELLTQALQQAVKKIRVQVQNPFAPKAFIIEGKQDGNDLVFKLSGGTDIGFNAGDNLNIFTRQIILNPLNGKESIEEIELTKGTISSTIGSNYAWITIENRSGAARIRLGDLVRVRFSKGFLENIGGLID